MKKQTRQKLWGQNVLEEGTANKKPQRQSRTWCAREREREKVSVEGVKR